MITLQTEAYSISTFTISYKQSLTRNWKSVENTDMTFRNDRPSTVGYSEIGLKTKIREVSYTRIGTNIATYSCIWGAWYICRYISSL